MSVVLGVVKKTNRPRISEHVLAAMVSDLDLGGSRKVAVHELGDAIFCHARKSEDEQDAVTMVGREELYLLGGRVFNQIDDEEHRRQTETSGSLPNAVERFAAAYANHGSDLFPRLNGYHVAAVWNETAKTLVIANDHGGLHPLFYCDCSDALVFCSEYQPLLKYSPFNKTLDHRAVAEFFTVGFVLDGKTFVDGLRNLLPASVLRFDGRVPSVTRYDDPEVEFDRSRPLQFHVDRFHESFHDSLQMRARSLTSKRCTLTGGTDTRMILGNLSESQRREFVFSTVQSPMLSADTDQDVIVAKILSEELDLKHHVTVGKPGGGFSEDSFEDWRSNIEFTEGLGGHFGTEFASGVLLPAMKKLLPPPDLMGQTMKRIEATFSESFVSSLDGLDDLRSWCRRVHDEDSAVNYPLLFVFQHQARSFLIGGAAFSGGWSAPWNYFLGQWITPFADPEFMKTLLRTPPEYQTDYLLYLEVLKTHHSGFMQYPIASCGLTDNRVRKLDGATAASDVRLQDYNTYSRRCAMRPSVRGREIYNQRGYLGNRVKSQVRPLFRDDGNRYLGPEKLFGVRFLDFEAWMTQYFGD